MAQRPILLQAAAALNQPCIGKAQVARVAGGQRTELHAERPAGLAAAAPAAHRLTAPQQHPGEQEHPLRGGPVPRRGQEADAEQPGELLIEPHAAARQPLHLRGPLFLQLDLALLGVALPAAEILLRR